MRSVIQRAAGARLEVDGETIAEFDCTGLVALVGVTHGDDATAARAMAAKIWRLRILEGELSASDVDAPVLVVSQFTLYGDTRKGRRPSWNGAAPGPVAEPLVQAVADELAALGARVQTGRFGAHMRVTLTNDGPVTVLVDTGAQL